MAKIPSISKPLQVQDLQSDAGHQQWE